MRLFAVAIAALLAAVAAGTGRTGSASPLQQGLNELVEAGAPGAILLVRDGSKTVRLTAGRGRLSTREAMHSDDRFRVGSLTKSFVATVVLELVGASGRRASSSGSPSHTSRCSSPAPAGRTRTRITSSSA